MDDWDSLVRVLHCKVFPIRGIFISRNIYRNFIVISNIFLKEDREELISWVIGALRIQSKRDSDFLSCILYMYRYKCFSVSLKCRL